MFTASSGIYFIDTFLKPFAKIYEKNPLIMLLIVLVLYSIIGYVVLKSAYLSENSHY
ncbi:MAG TPA: hypothetical protein V6C81_29030 [Planktothrix sp.]|jgi:hypothetical protein